MKKREDEGGNLMLDLFVAALCAYRLTQLVVWDTILHRPIDWLAKRSKWFSDLTSCAHCAGVWCSAFTAVPLYLAHIGWWPARYVLYAAGLAGAVSILEHLTGWLGNAPIVIEDPSQRPPTAQELKAQMAGLQNAMGVLKRAVPFQPIYKGDPTEELERVRDALIAREAFEAHRRGETQPWEDAKERLEVDDMKGE